MTRTLEVEAPAKVNLFLCVLERRPDGFHEIETLFQAISLSDRLVVSVEDDDPERPVTLLVEGADLGPVEANLAYRAAELFREAAETTASVRIALTKVIPAGAGLGGGSSDAAAVLRALAAITGFDDDGALHEIACALGSDVPFFLSGSPLALGRGRGEELMELSALPAGVIVVALPDVHVDTGEAYGRLAELRAGKRAPAGRGIGRTPPSSWDDVITLACNDFEEVVANQHEEIQASLDGLRDEGARLAMLSGSGAASFGLFGSRTEADRAASALERRLGWPFRVAMTRTARAAVG